MKNGRICAVEHLHQASDDKRIAESMELFQTKGLAIGAEGFEVWDQTRFVYRFVPDDGANTAQDPNRLKDPTGWLVRLFRRFTFRRALLAPSLAPV